MTAHDQKTLASLHRLYAKDLRCFAFEGGSRHEVELWAKRARAALRELIGLNRMYADLEGFTPSVSLGDSEEIAEYSRQKGVLQSEPGVDIPFWYIKPNGSGPHPVALLPHGHYAEHGLDYAVGIATSPEMEQKIKAGDRDVAIQAVKHGFAAIAPATRGFPPAGIPDMGSCGSASFTISQVSLPRGIC